MVGLRLRSGCVVKEGDPLYTEEQGVVPWAAALSDAVLSSNCAACFGPCDPLSRCPCHGPCKGALAYCSLSCRDLDLPLHLRSRECDLLALLQSPDSPDLASPLPSRFPSLGGTCDLRASLRLLAYHQALNHIAPFLAASRNRLHDVECPRLGGLLSNRCSLLQSTPLYHDDRNPEQDEDELLIATELREAAMLLHNVVYPASSESCVWYSPKHNQCTDHVSNSHMDTCSAGRVHLRLNENAHGHVNAHADVCMVSSGHLSTHKSCGNVHTRMDACMGGSEHLDMQEITHGHLHRHMDVHMVKRGDLGTHEAIDADPAASMAGADDEMWRKTAHGHVTKNMGVHTTRSGHLDTHGTTHADTAARMARTDDKMRHEMTHGHVHTHMDVRKATCGHFVTSETTLADTAARTHDKMPPIVLMTPAEEILLVEEVLCQVFTNAVRIQVDTWTKAGHLNVQLDDIGTAVYGPLLSWINHSCRPNAFYSFVLAGTAALKSTLKVPLAPDRHVTGLQDAWGLKSCRYPWLDDQGLRGYGPRACLRSMGNIKGLTPVCISYTDLLQPKSTRRRELWLKYRFNCVCERCDGKSTSNVDGILQNIGFWVPGSQRDMSTLEGWLHEESERGLSEFLNNDNPLSCCKILEDALVRILQEAYQNSLDDGILQTHPVCTMARLESFNLCGASTFFGHGSCSEAAKRHGMHVKVHLMHYLCLDIYMALSSSYKILATGFSGLRLESMIFKDSAEEARYGLPDGVGEVECIMVSAAYTIVLAVTIQNLCDSGEPGLLGIAARFWLQTGEAFVSLILKLDGHFFLDNTLEAHKLSRVSGDFKSIILFCDEKEFLWQLESFLNAHGRLLEAIRLCDSTSDLLRSMVTGLWPFLQSASRFLSYVETPFDINQVFFGSSGKQTGLMESKDVWTCYRTEAFICALCALRLGLKFMNICCGYNEKLIEAMKNLVCSCFQKT
eukprot:c12327_g1_i1 orf=224-3100(-)